MKIQGKQLAQHYVDMKQSNEIPTNDRYFPVAGQIPILESELITQKSVFPHPLITKGKQTPSESSQVSPM